MKVVLMTVVRPQLTLELEQCMPVLNSLGRKVLTGLKVTFTRVKLMYRNITPVKKPRRLMIRLLSRNGNSMVNMMSV